MDFSPLNSAILFLKKGFPFCYINKENEKLAPFTGGITDSKIQGGTKVNLQYWKLFLNPKIESLT